MDVSVGRIYLVIFHAYLKLGVYMYVSGKVIHI